MPRIFEKDGYLFFIYSNEHEPVHVHVKYGGGEAIFNIGDIIELRESAGLKVKELAKSNKAIIVKAWNEHISRQS